MNTNQNSMKSKLMQALLGLTVATLIPSGAAMAAVILIQEDFENDTLGGPPTNPEVGTWQPGTTLSVENLAAVPTKYGFSWNGHDTNGIIKAAGSPIGLGNIVHMEVDIHSFDGGRVGFGLTSVATDMSQAGLSTNATVLFQLQLASENSTFGLNVLKPGMVATNVDGLNYDIMYQNLDGNNPKFRTYYDAGAGLFSGTDQFDHVTFDYVVGDPTGTLSIAAGSVTPTLYSVTLSNPNAIPEGFFVTQIGTAVQQWGFDNILMTIPEPTTATLACLALAGLIVARRRRA